jgi:hypothetical protein
MHGIIILGASGHARVCLDILLAQAKEVIGFADDNPELQSGSVHGFPILGKISEVVKEFDKDAVDYAVAIGNNEQRRKIAALLAEYHGRRGVNVIHPSVIISPRVAMGQGNFLAPRVIINTEVGARVYYHARRWYVNVASAFPLAHHYPAVLAWGS